MRTSVGGPGRGTWDLAGVKLRKRRAGLRLDGPDVQCGCRFSGGAKKRAIPPKEPAQDRTANVAISDSRRGQRQSEKAVELALERLRFNRDATRDFAGESAAAG